MKGELTMMDFIKKHMGEILRPFAEHVDQLHKAVDQLGTDLEATDASVTEAHDQLNRHTKVLGEIRQDLDTTTDRSLKTQAGLEKTNAEKALLEADHTETKLQLGRVNARTIDTVAHMEKLQTQSDETAANLGKVKTGLASTDAHIKNDLEPSMHNHTEELQSLEANQQATAKLLAEVKNYGQNTHEEFNTFVDARERLNRKDQETFDHVHRQMAHLSTMLTETINRLNTHANHLKTTNATVRPMKAQIEDLINGQQVLQLQHRDTSVQVNDIRGILDGCEAEVKQLKQFMGASQQGENVHETISNMGAVLKKHATALGDINEVVKRHDDMVGGLDRRIPKLERGVAHLETQVKGLQDQVGIEAPPPPAMSAAPSGGGDRELPGAMQGMAALMKFQAAVNTVSIRERLKQYKMRIDNHDRDFESTNSRLQDTKRELEVKGQRVAVLEKELAMTNKLVDELKAGLELTEEYWKGLSGGFRETHKSINIEQALLPPKAALTLPVLKTPRPPSRAQRTM